MFRNDLTEPIIQLMFRNDLTEPIIQLKTPTSNNVGNSSGIETLSEYFLLQR